MNKLVLFISKVRWP